VGIPLVSDTPIGGTAPAVSAAIFLDLGGILRRRGWVVITAVLLAMATAAGVSRLTAPVYVATAVLSTDKDTPVVLLTSATPAPLATSGGSDAATLAELVTQDSVRAAVAERLRGLVDTKTVKQLWLKMRAQPVRDTNIVQVRVEAARPELAAVVANGIAMSVIDLDLSARRRWATNAREFIGNELEMARRNLQYSEDALTAFENENHTVELSEETQLNLRKLAALEDQLSDIDTQQHELQDGIVLQAVAAGPAGPQTVGPQSPLIANLQSQLATLTVELSGLRRQFTPLHPAVLSAEARLGEVRRRLAAEVASSEAALEGRGRSVSAAIGQIEQRLQGVPTLEARLARLTRDKTEAERSHALLAQRFQEAQIAEASIGSPIRIVNLASVPDRPARPQHTLDTLVGAILGLMLGVAAVFVEEHLDDTIRSSDDAEQALGVPVLGTLPLVVPRRRAPKQIGQGVLSPALICPDFPPRAVEAYRALRTQLLHALQASHAKCLLIASCLPAEAKSTVAANLAVIFAQGGRRKVWLIDGDLRQRMLDQAFPEAQSQGLAGYLNGESALAEVVRPTSVSGVSFVAGGVHSSAPTDQLGSPLMATLLHEGRASADVVLLDSPAFLHFADAEVMAGQTDATLLVVRADSTRRAALAAVRKRLEHLGVHLVGAVLVHVPSSRRTFHRGVDDRMAPQAVRVHGSVSSTDARSGHGEDARQSATRYHTVCVAEHTARMEYHLRELERQRGEMTTISEPAAAVRHAPVRAYHAARVAEHRARMEYHLRELKRWRAELTTVSEPAAAVHYAPLRARPAVS
jgi:polysaccharide biosynthesis transport protein